MKGDRPSKLLLLYVNLPNEPFPALGPALLSSYAKRAGADVRLFDTMFYDIGLDDEVDRQRSGQVESGSNISLKSWHSLIRDFEDLLNDFCPDVVGVSCCENTFRASATILDSANKSVGIPHLIVYGGPFATFAPEFIRSHFRFSSVGMEPCVCIGEGEIFIEGLMGTCLFLEGKQGFRNLMAGQSFCSSLVDLDHLALPDFRIYSDEAMNRPMAGKMYKMLPIEFSRGCPYACSYCSAPSYAQKMKGWFRQGHMPRALRDVAVGIDYLLAEYLYFISESFLALSEDNLGSFCETHETENGSLPFWFNTRPETVTEGKIRLVKGAGCHRISMGIEHGNEEFRKKILNRRYTNAEAIKAARIIRDAGIQLSVNSMIGFPDETEALIMDTVELNRHIEADSHTVSVFQPYRGTVLRDYCIEKGYYSKDAICDGKFSESQLSMSQFSKERITEWYFKFNEEIRK
jgi:radical SAM superfamily enzyme YgiQ (UPF0313 family)